MFQYLIYLQSLVCQEFFLGMNGTTSILLFNPATLIKTKYIVQQKDYNQGNKLSGQMRKTTLCLTPQAI